MIRLGLIATALLCAIIAAEEPPSLRYPDSRTSKKWIEYNGVRYAVDDGLDWQGVTVYLGSSELIAVEPGKEKALWLADVGAFWNFITFKELEPQPGKKVWAVELRARKDDDPDQKTVQYHDLKTGKKIEIPMEKPSGERLPKLRTLNITCSVAKPFFALVTTQENYDKVWKRLTGPVDPVSREDLIEPETPGPVEGWARKASKPLNIDFEKEIVLVFSMGDGANSSGIFEVESYEDEARILLRTYQSGFQTGPRFVFTRDCSLFVLPRRINKAYVLEHDIQNYINGPRVWKEQFRVRQIGDAAHELDSMPAPPAQKQLPSQRK